MKLFQAIANYVSGFWKNDMEPWLENLGNEVSHDVVTQLMPFANEAVQEILAGGGQLLAGTPVATVLSNTLVAVEATGNKAAGTVAQVAGHDLLTAVAAAVATAQAAANAKPAA